MQVAIKQTQLGLRNSTTRIPFRYGQACLTRCPQAVLAVTIEADGRRQCGYAGDCLPPSWFDKSPEKSYARQIDDMLAIIATAESVFLEEFARPRSFFEGWRDCCLRVHAKARAMRLPPLLAAFGSSMVERAVMDAMARAAGLSLLGALRSDLYQIRPAAVHKQLPARLTLDRILADPPPASVLVRHTIGMADPLTDDQIAEEDRCHDGLPQSLEDYLRRRQVRYFKIKVANQLEADLERLTAIARLIEQYRGSDYRVTLDGNEQYATMDQLLQLVDAIVAEPQLKTLWENVLLIEQPLQRSTALEAGQADAIRRLASRKPVIIDESDATLDAYPRAVELGYRGVSSKNCKGPVKSLLNAALTWHYNQQSGGAKYVMTGEDLCSVGIIPVQADLCLAAALGLAHVERNGHHYHRGLSYLPPGQQRAALAAHGDLYAQFDGFVGPRLVDGRFQIASLQCVGFGFAVEPDMAAMEGPKQWNFESLGLTS